MTSMATFVDLFETDTEGLIALFDTTARLHRNDPRLKELV
jgi:hypothetical protein